MPAEGASGGGVGIEVASGRVRGPSTFRQTFPRAHLISTGSGFPPSGPCFSRINLGENSRCLFVSLGRGRLETFCLFLEATGNRQGPKRHA